MNRVIYSNIKKYSHTNIMIFHKHSRIQFDPIDPLGDGLGDDIAAERREPEAIVHDFYDMIDPYALEQRWSAVLEEVQREPDWFDFAND